MIFFLAILFLFFRLYVYVYVYIQTVITMVLPLMVISKCNHVHTKKLPVKNNNVLDQDTIFTVKSLQTLVYFDRTALRPNI